MRLHHLAYILCLLFGLIAVYLGNNPDINFERYLPSAFRHGFTNPSAPGGRGGLHVGGPTPRGMRPLHVPAGAQGDFDLDERHAEAPQAPTADARQQNNRAGLPDPNNPVDVEEEDINNDPGPDYHNRPRSFVARLWAFLTSQEEAIRQFALHAIESLDWVQVKRALKLAKTAMERMGSKKLLGVAAVVSTVIAVVWRFRIPILRKLSAATKAGLKFANIAAKAAYSALKFGGRVAGRAVKVVAWPIRMVARGLTALLGRPRPEEPVRAVLRV